MTRLKNNIVKLLSNAIINALLGGFVGALITIWAELTAKKIPVEPVNVLLIFSSIVVLLSAIILQKLENTEEFRDKVIKGLAYDFMRIDKDSISNFATSLVKKSSYVRVVGTARQDVISGKPFKDAKIYLEALEKKLNKKCQNESERFTYYRVVPKMIKSFLEHHLETCIENAAHSDNNFDFKEIETFDFCVAYQIFDDTDLLLITDNKMHTGRCDNALCLWTQNSEIISTFIKMFDGAWR